MYVTEGLSEDLATDLARECLYRFLAVVLSDPDAERWHFVTDADNQRLARDAADFLRKEAGADPLPLGFGELPTEHLDVRLVLEELSGPLAEVREEYDRVFGLVLSRECPSYETEYHSSSEAFFRSQQLADIAGFFRAFGIMPAQTAPERPDFLPLELEFVAFLLMKKRLARASGEPGPPATELVSICEDAERAFFRDHLAWWVPAFATGLRRKAGTGLYAALARVLAALIPVERRRLDIPAPRLPVQAALIEQPEEQGGCADCAVQV
jgi:TorA maturation chaperone TorD